MLWSRRGCAVSIRGAGVLGERIDAAIIAGGSRIRRPSSKNSSRKLTLGRMWHPRHPRRRGTLDDWKADDLKVSWV